MKRTLILCLFLTLLLAACAANAQETGSTDPLPPNSDHLAATEPELPSEPVFVPAPEVPAVPRTVDPSRPMVALTYDDGPHETRSDQILDILEAHDARATFFEVGVNLSQDPDAVRRAEAMGCEVASHSYRHADLGRMSAAAIQEDTKAADDLFVSVLGHPPTLLRPPYGSFNKALKTATNHSLVTWTIDTLDWENQNTAKIVEAVQTAEKLDGQVVLFHSLYEASVEATKILVPWLQEQGYQLVTISELIALRFGDVIEPNRSYNYTYFLSNVPQAPASLSRESADGKVLASAETQLHDHTPVTVKLVMSKGAHLTMNADLVPLGGGYGAENYLGKCELQVWNGQTQLSSLPLTNRSGGEDLLFHQADFSLVFDDYNGDGNPDFTLGQWLNDYTNAYGVFTLDEKGSLQLLSEPFGISSSDAVEKGFYSAPLQKVSFGIQTFVYDVGEKGYWQQNYPYEVDTFALRT